MNQMDFYKKMGLSIKIRRAKSDLSQSDLAYMLGVSRVTVSMIESGKQMIPLHLYAMLVNIFGDSVPPISVFESAKTKGELKGLREAMALCKFADIIPQAG